MNEKIKATQVTATIWFETRDKQGRLTGFRLDDVIFVRRDNATHLNVELRGGRLLEVVEKEDVRRLLAMLAAFHRQAVYVSPEAAEELRQRLSGLLWDPTEKKETP